MFDDLGVQTSLYGSCIAAVYDLSRVYQAADVDDCFPGGKPLKHTAPCCTYPMQTNGRSLQFTPRSLALAGRAPIWAPWRDLILRIYRFPGMLLKSARVEAPSPLESAAHDPDRIL